MSKSGKIRVKTEFSETKLYELLKGLTKEEFKRFGLFVNSPYFNKSRTMETLYRYFKQNFDKLETPKITKENISKVIYPGEGFDDANVRKQLSNFTKLVLEFLSNIAIEKRKYTGKNILLSELLQRANSKTTEQIIAELRIRYKRDLVRDSEYYYNLHDTERTYFLFKSREMKNPDEHTVKTSFILDLHYISVKLLHYYTILNLRLHYNKQVQFDSWAFDDIVRFIEKHRDELSKEHKSLYADYLSVKMMLSPDKAGPFEELREYVSQNKNDVGEIEKHRMYIYLYNHSLYRYNRGYSQNPAEVFNVIREMESENVPLWYYFAFHMYYINAVKYSGLMNELQWAKEFMVKRREKITENIREETYSLAMAYFHFAKKDYSSALKYLVNVDYPNYSFYIGAKIMLLKIYWERSEPEGVLATIDAVRKFLQRKDLIPRRLHESYTNFINCVSKMVDPGIKERIFEIKKILEKEMSTSEKQWVSEKLKLLE